MHRKNLPLKALRAFESAAEHLHLGRAGDALGVTHGAISHQIRLLEEQLGVALFIRANNRLALTPAGARLAAAVGQGFDCILDGLRELDPSALHGELVVGCTQTTAVSWLVRQVCAFHERFPQIQIVMQEIKPRQKNIPQNIHVAICYGKPVDHRRQITEVGLPRLYPVGSPKLIKDLGRSVDIKNIEQFTLLHDNEVSWKRWFDAHCPQRPKNNSNIYFANTIQALSAARLGYGIALCNTFETHEMLQEGQLIRIINKPVDEEEAYFMLSDPNDDKPLRSKLFESWILGSKPDQTLEPKKS